MTEKMTGVLQKSAALIQYRLWCCHPFPSRVARRLVRVTRTKHKQKNIQQLHTDVTGHFLVLMSIIGVCLFDHYFLNCVKVICPHSKI